MILVASLTSGSSSLTGMFEHPENPPGYAPAEILSVLQITSVDGTLGNKITDHTCICASYNVKSAVYEVMQTYDILTTS